MPKVAASIQEIAETAPDIENAQASRFPAGNRASQPACFAHPVLRINAELLHIVVGVCPTERGQFPRFVSR